MKKIILLSILLFSFVLVSCPLCYSHLIGFNVVLDKYEIFVGESIEIEATVENISFIDGETSFIVYIENYPEDYEIIEGKLYEPLTTEKYLCIIPFQKAYRDGLVKVKISFQEKGEYTIKVNATSANIDEFHTFLNEENSIHTILVK
jgi:hypothetical protein